MDDQLDNDLKKRIREVFDNFEDGHADEGWLLLREKYPEKAKRRPVAWLWWGSAAAILLLFLGIFLFKQTPTKQNQVAHNQQQHIQPAPKAAEIRKGNDDTEDNTKADSVINSLKQQNYADNVGDSKNRRSKSTAKKAKYQSGQMQEAALPASKRKGVAGNAAKNDTSASENLAAISQPKNQIQNIIAGKADNIKKADTGSGSAAKALAKADKPNGINMQEEQKKTNKTLFVDNEPPVNVKEKNTDKAVRFGIYAATYFNYAKGSSNQMNVGAGVTSDIKLSKNLNLSTGLAIAQNTLSYANDPQINSPQLKSAAVAPAASSYFAVSNQSVSSAVAPSVKNYNANLVGLDVPLNLKYEFNPEKSAAFVSIGLSSGTFINETYTYRYSYNAPFSANISQVPDQSSHQSFNGFYFAKTLNFSFGTGYSLGQNKLIIEPFLKYPLDGLGAQQLRFGAGGINLKFNFQTQKK